MLHGNEHGKEFGKVLYRISHVTHDVKVIQHLYTNVSNVQFDDPCNCVVFSYRNVYKCMGNAYLCVSLYTDIHYIL